MARILIAGCGYVGWQLAQELASEAAHEIYCLRRHAPEGWVPRPGLRWFEADMARESLSFLPDALDFAVFAAAPGGGLPEAYREIYVQALGNVLDHLTKTGAPGNRLVLTSSTSAYANTDGAAVDEASPAEGSGPTGKVICEGERLLRKGDVAVRFGGIYGPGRTTMITAVRNRTVIAHEHSVFTNRIHRDDAAGILRHMLAIDKPESVYNGVDSAPAPRAEVLTWLAEQLGVPIARSPGSEDPALLRGNKRVLNARLLASGYQLRYPTYREGYEALLADLGGRG